MKRYLCILIIAMSFACNVSAQKNDLSLGFGITSPFILEDAGSDLTFDITSAIGITEKFGLIINSDYNFYIDEWGGGKYKLLNGDIGARFKFAGERDFATYAIKGGLTFSSVPSYIIYYDSGNTSLLYDNGIGFNVSLDIKYGLFLGKSKSFAIYINETIGYSRFSNDYTQVDDYYGYIDTYTGRTSFDLLFFNEKLGFIMFF